MAEASPLVNVQQLLLLQAGLQGGRWCAKSGVDNIDLWRMYYSGTTACKGLLHRVRVAHVGRVQHAKGLVSRNDWSHPYLVAGNVLPAMYGP